MLHKVSEVERGTIAQAIRERFGTVPEPEWRQLMSVGIEIYRDEMTGRPNTGPHRNSALSAAVRVIGEC